MELSYNGKDTLGGIEVETLELKIGDSSIRGIQFEGQQPLFSASDYLKLIGVRAGGSYYDHLINNSNEVYTFNSRRLGTYVSIDGMIKHSARDRRADSVNPFLEDVNNSIMKVLNII